MKKNFRLLLLLTMVLIAVPFAARTAQAATLSRPTLKSLKTQSSSVQVTWKKVSGAKGYYVYRKQGSGSSKRIAKVSGASSTSYKDTSVTSGKKYTYTVRAYKGNTKSKASKSLTTRFLSKPTLSGSTSSGQIKLSWKKTSGATGYKIYRKTSGSYKLLKTVKGASALSSTDSSVTGGKTYYYKIVAYKGSYQSASSLISITCKAATSSSGTKIETLSRSKNVAISADVSLTGSGTGYHAKLVIGTANSAVSFGLQFDNYADSPYAGHTAFLVENILSGTSQQYTRFDYNGSKYASLNKTYNLTLVVTKSTGKVRVYVNNKKVGSVTNKNLANQQLYVWVEGAARKCNDSVTANFKNIKVIENGALNTSPQVSYIQTASGIKTNTTVNACPSSIKISGTLNNLSSSLDWDSAPSSVNGYVRFY